MERVEERLVVTMYVGPKKKEKFRHWGTVVECTIMGLALCTIVLAVFIFFNVSEMLRWLPLMFLLAALVNVISAMKALYYGRKLAGLGLFLSSVAIVAFAVISYITLWI